VAGRNGLRGEVNDLTPGPSCSSVLFYLIPLAPFSVLIIGALNVCPWFPLCWIAEKGGCFCLLRMKERRIDTMEDRWKMLHYFFILEP